MFKVYKSLTTVLKRYFCVNSKIVQNRRTIRTALLQLNVGTNHFENLKHTVNSIRKAKENDAELVVLPVPVWLYTSKYGLQYSETLFEGPVSKTLSKAAKENSVYLVGGTFPEKNDSKVYNTCTVWNPKGELVAVYSKLHLFDVEIPDGITCKESAVVRKGRKPATFMINDVKVGLGICHDLRFEELAKLYRLQNCKILVYPSAFTMATGPMHFELLQRARAADNQVFVVCVSPARAQKGFISWGHSQVTNPWGKVLVQAGYKEEILYCDLDLSICDEARRQMPIFHQRRCDIYNTIAVD